MKRRVSFGSPFLFYDFFLKRNSLIINKFNRWYADTVSNGIPIEWEEML